MSRQRPESDTTENELEVLKQRLAALRGIGEAYFDYRGELRHFSPATRDALLAAMGCDLRDAAALSREIDSIESERWRVLLPAVVVLRPARMGVALSLPCDLLAGTVAWRVRLEDGGAVEGTADPESLAEGERREIDGRAISRRLLVLPEALPCGYHTLRGRRRRGCVGGLRTDHRAAALLRAGGSARRRTGLGTRSPALLAPLGPELGYR